MLNVNQTARIIPIEQLTTAPERINKVVHLKASPVEVFAVISNHALLPEIIPGMVKVTVDQTKATVANGEGTVRTCDLGAIGLLTEHIVYWDAPHAYAYSIQSPLGTTDTLGLMICEDNGQGGTVLTWKQYFNHPQVETIVAMISPMLDGAIQNLSNRLGGLAS